MGVLIVSLLPSAQLMSVVGILPIWLWQSWSLVSFDHVSKWLQSIGKLTPSYQLMQIVSSYLEHRELMPQH